jgi:DNA-directed RNA polymerase subunit M/transcription elongation factor TFIIS
VDVVGKLRRDQIARLWRAAVKKADRWYLLWQASRVKINLDEKCPSCGHRKGTIKFLPKSGKRSIPVVRHRCMICGHYWAEPTVMEIADAQTD